LGQEKRTRQIPPPYPPPAGETNWTSGIGVGYILIDVEIGNPPP